MKNIVSRRLRRIAADLDQIACDPEAVGLIESIIGIFGESWWESQQDVRLAEWYRRAQVYVQLKNGN